MADVNPTIEALINRIYQIRGEHSRELAEKDLQIVERELRIKELVEKYEPEEAAKRKQAAAPFGNLQVATAEESAAIDAEDAAESA